MVIIEDYNLIITDVYSDYEKWDTPRILTSQKMSVYATTQINTAVTKTYPSTAKIRAKMGRTPRLRVRVKLSHFHKTKEEATSRIF